MCVNHWLLKSVIPQCYHLELTIHYCHTVQCNTEVFPEILGPIFKINKHPFLSKKASRQRTKIWTQQFSQQTGLKWGASYNYKWFDPSNFDCSHTPPPLPCLCAMTVHRTVKSQKIIKAETKSKKCPCVYTQGTCPQDTLWTSSLI